MYDPSMPADPSEFDLEFLSELEAEAQSEQQGEEHTNSNTGLPESTDNGASGAPSSSDALGGLAVIPDATAGPSSSSTSGIINQLQTLTDIEGNLADTAMDVIESAGSGADAVAETNGSGANAGDGADHGSDAVVDASSSSTTLRDAQVVEGLLEQSIPAAPESQSQSQTQTQTQTQTQFTPGALGQTSSSTDDEVTPQATGGVAGAGVETSVPPLTTDEPLGITQPSSANPGPSASTNQTLNDETGLDNPNNDPSTSANTTAPTVDSSAADGANDAIQTVNANLTEPILPEQVVEPARDVVTETAIEEETSPMQIDVEEVAMAPEAGAEANANDNLAGEAEGGGPGPERPGDYAQVEASHVPTSQDGPSTIPLSQASGLGEPPNSSAAVVVEVPAQSGPLPEGLSEGSPSVIANRELVNVWRHNPSDDIALLALFNWSTQRTEINDARAWYNVLAVDNPTAIQPLLSLINLELALSNFPQVEALFAKALKGVSGGITAAADVSIWKSYLHYIRRQNAIVEGAPNVETVRATITKAYEFALKECGMDRESGELWQEYIDFLASAKFKNQWEEQQQKDNLRKIYQRAVCVPLNNVEALWKSYDAFENGMNKQTAKKFLAERSPAYMTARTALRELRALTDVLPHPVIPARPTFSDADRATVAGWKAYLKWEEGNPLVMDDQAALGGRIEYALRKCLGEMRHFPELWHYAANYHLKAGRNDEAAAVLKAGMEACPKSVLVTFAYADLEEDRKNLAACHDAYDSLVSRLSQDVEEMRSAIVAEVQVAKGPELPNAPGAGAGADGDADMNGDVARLVEEREARGRLVAERRGADVEDLQVALSVVWIMYMRFARRAEGIKAARGIFGKARKSPNITWHTFEASAMMEYHSNKDSAVAIRIFELGFKLFAENVDYVIKYLQFLLSVNDDSNARALFERSTVKIPAEKARPLWDTWARYEYMYGDLTAVHKLEARFAEAFPNDSPLKRFAQRFTFNGIDQIALRDLGFNARFRQPPPMQSQPPPLPPAAQMQPAPSAAHAHQLPLSHHQQQQPPPFHALPPVPTLPQGHGLPPPPPGAAGFQGPSPSKRPASPLGGGGGGNAAPSYPLPLPKQRGGRPSRSPSIDAHNQGQGPYKRYRTNSPGRGPPPNQNRNDRDRSYDRDRDQQDHARRDGGGGGRRYPSGSQPPGSGPGPSHLRERSPMLPPPPGAGVGYGAPPPMARGLPGGIPPGQGANPRDTYDRSGVAAPLAWFISTLPTARAFDGPVFRPDDILGLFGNISQNGAGSAPPIQPPVHRPAYPEPERRYAPPPMGARRY